MKKFFNIGVAVDTERGLVVPVIRDVDRRNVIQAAVELQRWPTGPRPASSARTT
jgi:pyruvate dehydrogenase E2 component (dihydrolipoamide acetyltransferase)